MPDRISNRVKRPEDTGEGANGDARWAGEPLEGSGFEEEIPETDFEWRD